MPSPEAHPPTARPMQARAREKRDRIETAALEVFAERGFDGASTGEIARRAGVTQQLVIYHYETKLALWKAAVDRVFTRIRDRSERGLEGLEGVDDATRVRRFVREFVLFSAEVPELARFMMHEGDRRSPRLEWLVERHIRPQFEPIVDAIANAQADGHVRRGDPAHVFALVLGSAAMLAQRAQSSMLTGRDMNTPEEVEAYADLVVRAIVSRRAARLMEPDHE